MSASARVRSERELCSEVHFDIDGNFESLAGAFGRFEAPFLDGADGGVIEIAIDRALHRDLISFSILADPGAQDDGKGTRKSFPRFRIGSIRCARWDDPAGTDVGFTRVLWWLE